MAINKQNMTLHDVEYRELKKLIADIESSLQKRTTTTRVRTLTRKVRLMLTRAERREKNRLL